MGTWRDVVRSAWPFCPELSGSLRMALQAMRRVLSEAIGERGRLAMYYEERLIGSVWCFRITPDGKWEPFDIDQYCWKVRELEAQLAEVRRQLEGKMLAEA